MSNSTTRPSIFGPPMSPDQTMYVELTGESVAFNVNALSGHRALLRAIYPDGELPTPGEGSAVVQVFYTPAGD